MPLLVPSMKKKTCPTCRTEVRARPVVAYLIKSALDAVLPCLDPSTYDKVSIAARVHDDPFKDLFPPDLSGSQARHRANIMEAHPDVLIDDEDGGVPRCPRCIHEIFDGVCTGCGRLYDGISEEEGLDDIDSDDGGIFSRLNRYGIGNGPGAAGWPYSDDEHVEEEEEPYESDFIDDGPLELQAHSEHDSPQGQRYYSRASVNAPGPSRVRRTVVITSSDDEHSSAASDADNWESYLGRTARRHGSDGSSPVTARPRRRAPVVALGAIIVQDASEGESDWAARPRHERLASEERAAARRDTQQHRVSAAVIPDEEESGTDNGHVPHYVSVSEDDDIRPPWAPRRGPRRVVNLDDEDENSENDVFEDAASEAALTATSGGGQSSRYQLGVTDSDPEDVVPPRRAGLRLRPREFWNEEETEVDEPASWDADPDLDLSENDHDRHTSDESDSEDDDHSDVSSDSF